jgi:hypothetical protein
MKTRAENTAFLGILLTTAAVVIAYLADHWLFQTRLRAVDYFNVNATRNVVLIDAMVGLVITIILVAMLRWHLFNLQRSDKLTGMIFLLVGIAILLLPLVSVDITGTIFSHNVLRNLFEAIYYSCSFVYLTGLFLAATGVWSIFLIRNQMNSPGSEQARELPTSGGYGGVPAEGTLSESTRYLCASALLAGASFRQGIIERLRHKHTATAPEVGLDLDLVTQVCLWVEKRERTYSLFFALSGLLILIGLIPGLLLLLFIGAISGAVLWLYKSCNEKFRLVRLFRRDRFWSPGFREKIRITLPHHLKEGLPKEDQNLLIYSGFTPFVGAGYDLGGWSFAIDVSQPEEGTEPQPFILSELYQRLEEGCKSLEIPGLEIKDYLFVHGADIRADENILPDPLNRPVQSLPVEEVKRYSMLSDFRIRHYKWVRIRDWGNEIIFSLFMRCTLRGPNLFVEVNRFLLTPTGKQYRSIDAQPNRGLRDFLSISLIALFIGPLYSLYMPFALLARGLNWINRHINPEERALKREIKYDPMYNYGVGDSIRGKTSSPFFVSYFQKLDREMYTKTLDKRILDTFCAFLEEHNVDISDLKTKQTTIINSGIMVQGGDVQAQSVAVGTGAQAITTPPAGLENPVKERAKRT